MQVAIVVPTVESNLKLQQNKLFVPLVQILGLSIIERMLLTLRSTGLKDFIIIGDSGDNKIQAYLERSQRFKLKIQYEHSTTRLKNIIKDNFLLLPANQLFDRRILEKLISTQIDSSLALAIDKKKLKVDDTQVLEKDGKILDIGMNLLHFNSFSTQMMICSPEFLSILKDNVKTRDLFTIFIRHAIDKNIAYAVDITHGSHYIAKTRKEVLPWWIKIEKEEDINAANKILLEDASKDASDFIARYIHKPLENKLVYYIASNSKITPNQITLFINILAYSITVLFALGHLLIASILTFLVGVVDGIDGKLARVKFRTSKLGQLEHAFDFLFELSWITALAWYLFIETSSVVPFIIALLIFLFVPFYRFVYDQFSRVTGKSLDVYGEFDRHFRRIAGRRNLYNIEIFIGILTGYPLYSLFAIAFHSGLTACVYALRAIIHLHNLDMEEELS